MIAVRGSMAARVRALKERQLPFDEYARELVSLADAWSPPTDPAVATTDWTEDVERPMTLRVRIADLEKRVRALEMGT